MSVGDTKRTTVTVDTVERPPTDARIRHFDELSHREQRRFLRLVEDGTVSGDRPLFTAGEVVVFTDYYRIRTA